MPCPIRQTTTILVYNDVPGGAGHLSTQWEQAFWSWATGEYPSFGAAQFILADDLANCDSLTSYPNLMAWVQPGGNAYLMTNALGVAGKAKIVDFVKSGGLYVGTCAGWYYSSTAYYWEYNTGYPDAGLWHYPALLGLFPKTVEGCTHTTLACRLSVVTRSRAPPPSLFCFLLPSRSDHRHTGHGDRSQCVQRQQDDDDLGRAHRPPYHRR